MAINVTKTFLPPKEEYFALLEKVWDRAWITNNGPLVVQLEEQLRSFLAIDNLWYTNNGTAPMQLAIKGLELNNSEIITTPFSYVATTNTIIWENCKPVFVDINKLDFNIDASKIEEKINFKTKAILATHVYGLPCDVFAIEKIAKKYNLTVIYDAAHAFGVKMGGKSLLSYGDVSTCSFHATKVFHTVEGGAIILNDSALSNKIYYQRQFGHKGDEYLYVGINAKNSEMHAAMGICNMKYLDNIIDSRREASQMYDKLLDWTKLSKPKSNFDIEYNFAYYPVLFQSEAHLLAAFDKLAEKEIYPRRYFYPSLNTLQFLEKPMSCPISEDVSVRVACLPLYYELETELIHEICASINLTT
jgi:dTDP-4-amino-4,6-dideoxygalactose transaminase